MKKLYVVLLVIVISASISLYIHYTKEVVVAETENWHPTSTDHQIINHKYYSLSYREEHEQAEWVAYLLTQESIRGHSKRVDNFREDPKVTTGSASLKDYKRSGYDRGHLCPAADMKLNREAMSETFFMSNMSPQHKNLNRKAWNYLEQLVRRWGKKEEAIYIVTGPILTDIKKTIGKNKVSVPKAYYKIVYDYSPKGQEKMIGFILPNGKTKSKLAEYVVTVDSIESVTQLDFFPQLEDQLENKLEATSNFNAW